MRPTYEELVAENRRLQAQVQGLQIQVQELTRLIEKLRREGKRQAAPFRKQEEPVAQPKKPGRKSGRRHGPHAHRVVPPRIDETYDVPLPKQCPHCDGRQVRETHVAPQYQTDIHRTIIYRQFDVHVGVCAGCGQTVQARHALHNVGRRGKQWIDVDFANFGQMGYEVRETHQGFDEQIDIDQRATSISAQQWPRAQ